MFRFSSTFWINSISLKVEFNSYFYHDELDLARVVIFPHKRVGNKMQEHVREEPPCGERGHCIQGVSIDLRGNEREDEVRHATRRVSVAVYICTTTGLRGDVKGAEDRVPRGPKGKEPPKDFVQDRRLLRLECGFKQAEAPHGKAFLDFGGLVLQYI